MTGIVLGQAPPEASAIERIRAMLNDEAIDLVYRRSASGTWIDELGTQVAQSVLDSGRTVTPLERDGDWIAALIHDPQLLDDPAQLQTACNAVTGAIDDERLRADLRAQIRDEQASRERVLVASDRQRRRFERNLHDGAQQRLVGLALMLRMAGRRADSDSSITELLTEAVRELDDAIEDLRELARGLHPAIVNDAGLAAAVESLAERPGIPVELVIDLSDRLPERVEVGAYYLVAESLANANKHSGATGITVTARVVDEALQVSVSDDGRGGLTASGSGLVGLADRIGSLGGLLTLESEVGQGTTVTGYLPLNARVAASRDEVDDILLRVFTESEAAASSRHGTTRSARSIYGDFDRRRRALKWMAWQNHAAPGEIIEAQPESEDFLYAKAALLFLGGNLTISTERRDWVIGYLTAAGYSEEVLEATANYDDRDRLEDLMKLPRVYLIRLVVLYDALKACAMDSVTFNSDAFDPVLRGADAIGIPREVVADLHEIVLEEARLRQRRHNIVVAPTLPRLVNDSIALTKGASPDPE